MAFDAKGDLYVADTGEFDLTFVKRSVLRKIVSGANVITLASLPDGTLTTQNTGIAVDGVGSVYVSTSACPSIAVPSVFLNCGGEVSRVTAEGVRTTLQVNGANTSFNRPFGIALDSASIIYVAELNAQAISKIAADRQSSSVLQISYPSHLAVDQDGSLYAVTTNYPSASNTNGASYQIARINKDGTRQILADGVGGGAETAGIAADAKGNVYVADSTSLRKISPVGVVTTIAGTGFSTAPLPLSPVPLPSQIGPARALAIFGADLYVSAGSAIAVIHNVP
ncbi:MAG: hypothetical protein ABL931_11900 [Usitatibacteraceae bacterium]